MLFTGGGGGTGANQIKAMTNKATKAAIIPIPTMTVFWSWSNSIILPHQPFQKKIHFFQLLVCFYQLIENLLII
jgi:hypothetical protein